MTASTYEEAIDLIGRIVYCAGIGLALTKKLARQGLNVVVVALNDQLLHTAFQELQQQHPAVSFRKVGSPNHASAACNSSCLSSIATQMPIAIVRAALICHQRMQHLSLCFCLTT